MRDRSAACRNRGAWIRALTGAYFLSLALIVYCADRRAHQHLFAPIRSLPLGDKCGHFMLMGVLAGLVNLCLRCRRVRLAGVGFLFGSALVVALVTLEEFSQLLVPYRSFDLFDLAADYLGVSVFGLIASSLCARREGREAAPE